MLKKVRQWETLSLGNLKCATYLKHQCGPGSPLHRNGMVFRGVVELMPRWIGPVLVACGGPRVFKAGGHHKIYDNALA